MNGNSSTNSLLKQSLHYILRLARYVKTYYCLWQAVGDDLIFEVKVTDPKNYQRDVGQEEHKVKTWVLNDGGRQENSLRTVRSISQVLYTNTGWSVCTCLGQAYILKRVAHTLGQVQIQVTGVETYYCLW